MRQLCLVSLLLFTFYTPVAQTKLNAVYAGIEFRLTINGTETFYQSYYFRPNGTYCYELDKPDWKTAVSGTYTFSGKKITLVSARSSITNTMDIISDDIIKDNSTSLVKYYIMNEVPAQHFLQVSDDGQTAISFDGKGHFVTTGYRGSSMLNKKNDYDGEGTYTIKESELSLTFTNGNIETKSFFYSGGKTATALINGSTYNASTKSNTTLAPQQKSNAPAEKQEGNIMPVTNNTNSSMAILQKANLVHGGKMLDDLKTIKLHAAAGSLSIVQLLDVENRRIRIELYNNNKLSGIEQAENNSGWQWKNGKLIALSAARINEMQATFVTGILGLRQEQLKKIKVQSVKKSEDFTTVTFSATGQTYNWIFDAGSRLEAEVNAFIKHKSVFRDFRLISGVLVPFTAVETNNMQSFTVNYSSININTVLTTTDWSKPE